MRTIETGTVQNGLKLISTIRLWMSGEGRSGLPATAVWRDTATPSWTASIQAAGMLAITKRAPSVPEKARSRTTLVRSWLSRASAGTLSDFRVCSRTCPSALSPWRAWNRRTAAST